MNDTTDDAAVINPRLASGIGREMRLNARKLFVAKPEIVAIHRWAPFGNLESQTDPAGNQFHGS
jgi:hypothetical protein